MSKNIKERIKELEDLAKKRFADEGGFNVAAYLNTDEYDELLELEEKLEGGKEEIEFQESKKDSRGEKDKELDVFYKRLKNEDPKLSDLLKNGEVYAFEDLLKEKTTKPKTEPEKPSIGVFDLDKPTYQQKIQESINKKLPEPRCNQMGCKKAGIYEFNGVPYCKKHYLMLCPDKLYTIKKEAE